LALAWRKPVAAKETARAKKRNAPVFILYSKELQRLKSKPE
jgi:hypothetical protein